MDDIKRVAAELMDPARLHVVVVGQPEGLDGAAEADPAEVPAALPAEGAMTETAAPAAAPTP
jgi:zinc protease